MAALPRFAILLVAFAAAGAVPIARAFAQSLKGDDIPTMQLEGLYRGPLRDTIIQRWRDPVGGNICYLFIPISQEHGPPNPSGYVQYGPHTIGSISCVAAAGGAPVAQRKDSGAGAPGQPAAAKQGGRTGSQAGASSRARPGGAERSPSALSSPPSEALAEPKRPASE
jgi:hypothetical protein